MHLLLTLLLAANDPAATTPKGDLPAVIANLEAAERLYSNHDAQLRYEMTVAPEFALRYSAPKPKKPSDRANSVLLWLESGWDDHCVQQDDRFRNDRSGHTTLAGSNKPLSNDNIDAYDGKVQRSLSHKHIANRSDFKRVAKGAFVPHLLLLRPALIAPLSLLLKGSDAVKRSEYAVQLKPHQTLSSRYLGAEIVDGLMCDKVALDTFTEDGSRPFARFEIWLARERNYLPSRVNAYTFMYSLTVPVSVGRVARWMTIAPGIWMPAETDTVKYDGLTLHDTGLQKQYSTSKYFVITVSLIPNYPASYFSDVPFPNGAHVYELNSPHHVSNSYIQGGSVYRPPMKAGPSWMILTILLNAIGLALITAMAVLRYRRRTALGRTEKGPQHVPRGQE
jgi:hypothetical protein